MSRLSSKSSLLAGVSAMVLATAVSAGALAQGQLQGEQYNPSSGPLSGRKGIIFKIDRKETVGGQEEYYGEIPLEGRTLKPGTISFGMYKN